MSRPDGPAAKAGVAVGDILVSVDGQPAENLPTVTYNFRLRDTPTNVQLVVLRGEAQLSISVDARSKQRSRLRVGVARCRIRRRTSSSRARHRRPRDRRRRWPLSATGLRDPYGIIVVGRAASAASDVPVLAKDIIRSVNNRRVTTLDGLRDSVKSLAPGTPVTMQIQRDGRLDVRVVHFRIALLAQVGVLRFASSTIRPTNDSIATAEM